jgi:hypothetical protein
VPFSAPQGQESPSPLASGTSEPPLPPPLILLKSAEDWLKIIEDSLNEQGLPVEKLSVTLPELYQKSLALEQSVNELLERSGRLEKSLEIFRKQLKENEIALAKKYKEAIIWKILIVAGISAAICYNVDIWF